jgi:hypothetical protein
VAFAPLTRGRSNKRKGPADTTVYPPVSVFLGDCGACQAALSFWEGVLGEVRRSTPEDLVLHVRYGMVPGLAIYHLTIMPDRLPVM